MGGVVTNQLAFCSTWIEILGRVEIFPVLAVLGL
jgi:hypothetical protein